MPKQDFITLENFRMSKINLKEMFEKQALAEFKQGYTK